jgi:hypothetical protein
MSWKPTDNMTEEEIRYEKEKCLVALAEMHNQVRAWKDSLINNARERAPKEGYEGWDFLVGDLQQEIDTFIWPYASRFYQCGYMEQGEVWAYLRTIEEQLVVLKQEVEDLAEEGRRIEREKNSLKYRIKRRLLRWLA